MLQICDTEIVHALQVKIRTFVTPHRTYECITVIRCLYQKYNNPKLWEKIINLESHCNERRGSDKYESDRMIIAQFLHRFFKIKCEDFSEDEILKICGVIQVLKVRLGTSTYLFNISKMKNIVIWYLVSMTLSSNEDSCSWHMRKLSTRFLSIKNGRRFEKVEWIRGNP